MVPLSLSIVHHGSTFPHVRLARPAGRRRYVHPILPKAYNSLPLTGRCASNACTKSYTVQSGDNCDAIAVAQGVSSYQVAYLNGGSDACDSLQIGQTLCLATDAYNCQPVYTIQDGDE